MMFVGSVGCGSYSVYTYINSASWSSSTSGTTNSFVPVFFRIVELPFSVHSQSSVPSASGVRVMVSLGAMVTSGWVIASVVGEGAVVLLCISQLPASEKYARKSSAPPSADNPGRLNVCGLTGEGMVVFFPSHSIIRSPSALVNATIPSIV